ncbi:MAG: hypothetical protein EP343_20990 [Deltaproteobacteria bacterium]|nr:MAG: hypothetical protein EP343_20990 [Deltaproteobacteria bacterium]
MQPDSMPKWTDEKLEQAYRELRLLSQDPELRAQYEAQLKEIRDYQAGMQDSYMKGKEEGKEEGRQEERRELARNMLAQGLEIEMIASVTGLPLPVLQNLSNQED